ncbi:MAG TPA: LON peptidase substrate-binding domain-containing protein [Thermoanaerobaculia bacterium]|nr:LON peptidase substrate-binding domain-containing protein [Thermoanaerobaculia bacterium]
MADFTVPAVIPVFPLTGTLLLPGTLLPLNIFEPRYRNMVADALEGERAIGMIQPFVPRQDNWPALELPPENPELYPVGCLGRMERCEPQPDGRYEIVLRGICRFRIREELPLHRGYRRVRADTAEFAADLNEPASALDPSRLLAAVRTFGASNGLDFDLDLLSAIPGVSLLNGLSVALPFRPAEKQALLEAGGPEERERLLLALMGMGLEPMAPEEYYAPPTVH